MRHTRHEALRELPEQMPPPFAALGSEAMWDRNVAALRDKATKSAP